MPFIGRDWRSPGEAWVKTESLGWQRMKLIESQLHLPCHQSHTTACSWPPRSSFGQHMEANCSKQATHADEDQQQGYTSCYSRDIGVRGGNGSNSPDSSSNSSTSGSPTGTPEKLNNARHIHPITISSPYGRYSASCCVHHNHDYNRGLYSPCKSPTMASNCLNRVTADCRQNNNHNHLYHHQNNHHNDQTLHNSTNNDNAQAISRSLSRETINSLTDCLCAHPASRGIRHNNSEPDFRATNDSRTSTSPKTSAFDDGSIKGDTSFESKSPKFSQPQMVVFSQEPSPSVPLLMKNGLPMEADERNGHLAEAQPQAADEIDLKACRCCCCSSLAGAPLMLDMQQPKTAPHCRISVRTREVAMHNTISEAFYRLDFYNAIHDIRRFNYICKLLHLLITQNLTSLSGCATRVLFTMLEQVAWEVSSNKRNIHVIRNLLDELKQTIQKYYCWGRPIGSSLLWQQHFETIERIGQIVNGIELSPPKNDSYNVTFDKLPVEMVREILFRLNDYRDLVNSAQASPVMRTMIDSQSIWQKLCRYHFTEQQLKLAIEGGNCGSILGKKNASRGIKYARTTSADGRSSYRNPVAHKPSSSSTSRVTATRQQLEQTSSRRGSATSHTNRRCPSSSSDSPTPSTSKSYVTSAVKIFDDKHRSVVERNCDRKAAGQLAAEEGAPRPVGNSRLVRTEEEEKERDLSSSSSPFSTSNSRSQSLDSPNVDWERVFHQLRKRFDLKEEYADCLLLCRHCRCLFWKSIGHPCIRSEDMRQQPGTSRLGSVESQSRPPNNGAAHSRTDQSGEPRDKRVSLTGRPSVALLSRNFDRTTQAPMAATSRGEGAGGANFGLFDENVRPASGVGNQSNFDLRPCPSGRAASDEAQRQNRHQPLNNLDALLRQHNVDRQERQQRHPLSQLNGDNVAGASRRGEELVPKHVTITPQAFLKFFSL